MNDMYPLQGTLACRMFHNALERAQERGENQREVARKLGYRSSVVVSHMASGRAPIPIDRASEFAQQLGIDTGRFLLAVLEQRHRDIDFARMLAAPVAPASDSKSTIVRDLEDLAGGPLDTLPSDHLRIIKEVVASRDPAGRWANVSEVQALNIVRAALPVVSNRSLTQDERGLLRDALQAVTDQLEAGSATDA